MFAKLSSEQALYSKIELDNLFVVEYMPYAPENYVKVYLYGLSLAYTSTADNTLSGIARQLSLDESLVLEAFGYWEEQGLVTVLETDPPCVEFLPVRPLTSRIRKFSKEKYKVFNDQLHAMLPNRNILPNEYNEYYDCMESKHIDIEGMLTIIAYCVRLKGESVGYAYILTVARNLASEGYHTSDRIAEKLSELDLYGSDLSCILKTLGSRRKADHNDHRMFVKWTRTLGFDIATIIGVAKTVKSGGMDKLDSLLGKYYENHAITMDEINNYIANRDRLYDLTRRITKVIGVYYEQLDHIIETYVIKWLGYGFDDETLIAIAEYCFRRGIRTLGGMDDAVNKFYRQGLITMEAINNYTATAVKADEQIRAILAAAGTERGVTSWDRDYYRTWTFSWKMPHEVILHAATLAKGKANAMPYIGTVLATWNEKGLRTLDDVRAHGLPNEKRTTQSNVTTKSSEELNALFAHIDPEDI